MLPPQRAARPRVDARRARPHRSAAAPVARSPRRCGARMRAAGGHAFDVLGLSNLCVDVVIPVEQLPSPDAAAREALLRRLTAAPPGEASWELGGISNFAVAAARLGLRTGAVGHLGSDVYGSYMERVLGEERITAIERIAPPGAVAGTPLDRTLVCFVLVDPEGGHAFCSRYDFGPWPLLEGVDSLPPHVMRALASTRAVCANGFVFDELPLSLVRTAVEAASAAGAAIFFDPGPRCHTMKSGSRLQALETMMSLSDAVLLTMEEAFEVTGCSEPLPAAAAVLARSGAQTRWCVVKEGGAGALLAERAGDGSVRAHRCPAMEVEVVDTVGCGDSFAAAIVAGFINGHDAPGTLALANAVGAATATGRGAGRNVADVATVQRLLSEAARGGRHEAGAIESARRLLELTRAGGSGGGNGNGNGNGRVGGPRRRDGAGDREAAARAA
ncbi:sugar carbohydrate kinase [Raphidocelis subcapitata]|uniref:Sugar carbohydrate kinase n=1 Tax=Raphidocelis subcapitata TaxID=307507 RepID=A0A2V0NZB3_9CHLO|nr:sugar carbohydrate kinase [Raphidocelis subcapitata]|eukprot:GBF90155.1 sugar carbohydrate kinase [Raphidocelis subcapitata]